MRPALFSCFFSRRFIFAAGGILLAAVMGGCGLFWYRAAQHRAVQARLHAPVGPPSLDVSVVVAAGMTASQIEAALLSHGVGKQQGDFRRAARQLGVDRALQAGPYRITGDLSLLQIAAMMAKGEVHVRVLRVPEGATLALIAELAERAAIVAATDLLDAASAMTVSIGGRPAPSMEGLLFPASYPFPPDATPGTVLAAMHQKFRAACLQVGLAIDNATVAISNDFSLTPLEVVTLASIVESEAVLVEERPRIAGVFLNRLRRKMPLQSCATVYAALGERPVPLLAHHLKVESPYNTYRRRGLPPGPICSPGMEALRAVLDPEQHDYLYFVARGDGGHEFSSTLDAHNRAKQRYKQYARTLSHDEL